MGIITGYISGINSMICPIKWHTSCLDNLYLSGCWKQQTDRAGFPRPGDTWSDFLMVQSEEGWRLLKTNKIAEVGVFWRLFHRLKVVSCKLSHRYSYNKILRQITTFALRGAHHKECFNRFLSYAKHLILWSLILCFYYTIISIHFYTMH